MIHFLFVALFMNIGVEAKPLTEASFHRAINRVENFYKSTFISQNKDLKITRKWESLDAVAHASQIGNTSSISIYGGFKRFPYLDENSLIFVTCHEVGHFLGGSPKNHDPKYRELSVEGQADYFATAKCLKQILKNDPTNSARAKEVVIEDEARAECANQYQKVDDINICLISSEIAIKIGKFVNENKGRFDELSLMTPDKDKVFWRSLDLYQDDVQCRMDTIYQGALCNLSPLDPRACDEVSGAHVGLRPRCWFRPSR